MITLSVFLTISLALNILLIWYSRKLTSQFVFFAENLQKLQESLDLFDGHLRAVHELEMFYGDDTLGNLIEHSRAVVESVSDFRGDFSMEDEELGEEDENGST